MIGPDEGAHQEKRNKLDSDDVLRVESDSDFLRADDGSGRTRVHGEIGELAGENEAEQRRKQPTTLAPAAAFGANIVRPRIDQHNDEDEEDDNGASIDDDLESSHERRTQQIENDGDANQPDDKIEQSVDGADASDG